MDIKKIINLLQASAGLNDKETYTRLQLKQANYSLMKNKSQDIKLSNLIKLCNVTGNKLVIQGTNIYIDLTSLTEEQKE